MYKILLVEDDPMISEIYIRKFKDSGIDVTHADGATKAIDLMRDEDFDLVLLDLVLPEMSGFDILYEVKKSGRINRKQRVIIFSNLNSDEDRERAFENGADGFLSKMNYGPSEIVEKIKALIDDFRSGSQEDKKDTTTTDDKEGVVGKRILFIEDEDIFQEMFGKKMEEGGYFVVYAKNGAWGLRKALEEKFDLLITDMVIPAISGKEIIEKLRENESTKNMPIIMLSASVPEEELMEIKNSGIDDYFVKTRIVPSDLLKRIDEILK